MAASQCFGCNGNHCNGCMWILFANSIPALVGFLQTFSFPLHLKIGILSYFWSIVSGLFMCTSLLGCLRFDYLCVRCCWHTPAPWKPSGLEVTGYKNCKLLLFIIIIMIPSYFLFIHSLCIHIFISFYTARLVCILHNYEALIMIRPKKKKKLFGCPPPPALNFWKLEKSFYWTTVYRP